MEKNYYAILPANVRYAEISSTSKLLYAEITALSNEVGYCWASNSYFANLYDVTNSTISRKIKELEDNGFIKCKYEYEQGKKQIKNRLIFIAEPIRKNAYTYTQKCVGGIRKNAQGGIRKNDKDNNININTINEYKENIYIKEKSRFKKPSVEEIEKYCLERGNNINARQFYDFYEMKGWYVGKNKMKDWKAGVRTWETNNKKRNDSLNSKKTQVTTLKADEEYDTYNNYNFEELMKGD